MACKVESYLIKLITFTCTDLLPKKACEATKEKKDAVSNWSYPKSLSSQFWFYFHVSTTVVAVDLFVAVAAAAGVVVPVVGKDIQE